MKPIFTIGIPNVSEYEKEKVAAKLNNEMHDYHVLVYSSNSEDIVFNFFNLTDANDITLAELKDIIKK